MVSLTALWLPIVVSAVVVFVASSVIHMVLTYHNKDYAKLPDEDTLLEAMRKAGISPGAYMFPAPDSRKEMGSPEMMEKYKRGPVGLLQVLPPGPPMMPKHLIQWFVLCLLVALFAGYVGSHCLAEGAEYLAVFQVVGTAAVLGFCFGDLSDSIWKGQLWSTTLKNVFDGLIYALLTAGVFGWLWPG